jgi:uncharacterized protein (DUF736 family)
MTSHTTPRNSVLQVIGTFVQAGDIITGTVQTLTITAKVNIVPVAKTSAHAPDYRVLCGAVEFGAGWARNDELGRETISIKLDDPALLNPIYATLCADDDTGALSLLWSRPKGK